MRSRTSWADRPLSGMERSAIPQCPPHAHVHVARHAVGIPLTLLHPSLSAAACRACRRRRVEGHDSLRAVAVGAIGVVEARDERVRSPRPRPGGPGLCGESGVLESGVCGHFHVCPGRLLRGVFSGLFELIRGGFGRKRVETRANRGDFGVVVRGVSRVGAHSSGAKPRWRSPAGGQLGGAGPRKLDFVRGAHPAGLVRGNPR
jgi:hypothetical protein